jgi:hypothetical protein
MRIRTVFLACLYFSLIGCGEQNTPAGPGDPGNGDGLVTLLDATDASEWSCEIPGSSNCNYCQVTSGAIVVRDSTYLNPDSRRCNSLGGRCTFRLVHRLDFRPYESARLQCHIERSDAPFGAAVSIWIRSNVPGTPDLNVYSTMASRPEDVDLSLENALTYAEATVEIIANAYASGEPSQGCGDTASIVLSNFRVVAVPGSRLSSLRWHLLQR